MQRKTVFLLQDTKELNDELRENLENEGEYRVVGSAVDGISGIAMITELKPQIVVMELVLSGFDGLCVLNKIEQAKLNTKVIVLSSLCGERIIARAMTAGATYFMAKPFDYGVLKERIKEVAEEKIPSTPKLSDGLKDTSLEEKISNIFINVGIPPHIKGYAFLREAVRIAVSYPDVINNITKKLYPMIGERFDTSASKVERAIRHAIEVAWNRGRIESINGILGVRAYVGSEKPTNGEFIALIADKMLLEKA